MMRVRCSGRAEPSTVLLGRGPRARLLQSFPIIKKHRLNINAASARELGSIAYLPRLIGAAMPKAMPLSIPEGDSLLIFSPTDARTVRQI